MERCGQGSAETICDVRAVPVRPPRRHQGMTRETGHPLVVFETITIQGQLCGSGSGLVACVSISEAATSGCVRTQNTAGGFRWVMLIWWGIRRRMVWFGCRLARMDQRLASNTDHAEASRWCGATSAVSDEKPHFRSN